MAVLDAELAPSDPKCPVLAGRAPLPVPDVDDGKPADRLSFFCGVVDMLLMYEEVPLSFAAETVLLAVW